MTWIPGTGELSNRLARALGVKGRISTEIDEQVVAQVLLSDAPNKPPYRTDGRLCFSASQNIVGVLASPPQVSILNSSSVLQIVKTVYVVLGQLVSARFILAQGPIIGDNSIPLVTAEAIGAGLSEQTALVMRTHTSQAQPGGIILWQETLLVNTVYRVDLDLVLQPNAQLFISSNSALGDMMVSLQGLFFLR